AISDGTIAKTSSIQTIRPLTVMPARAGTGHSPVHVYAIPLSTTSKCLNANARSDDYYFAWPLHYGAGRARSPTTTILIRRRSPGSGKLISAYTNSAIGLRSISLLCVEVCPA